MRARRGNVAIKVALSMTVTMGMAAISVDLGFARVVRVELGNAAEAAAHAGAAQLDGTDAGVVAARTTAILVGNQHRAGGTPVELTSSDVVTGIWDADAGTFTPSSVAESVNAVRVDAARPELGLFFAPVAFAQDTVSVGASAVALASHTGAGEVECFLPMAIPQCHLDEGLESAGYVDFKVNPPSEDNIGWARPSGTPNAAWTRDQIGNCEADGSAAIGDSVGLQNGTIPNAINAMVDAMVASDTTWETPALGTIPGQRLGSELTSEQYGRTLEGPVFVFDGGDEYCNGGGQFNGTEVITGFAWAVVYDVENNGAAQERTMYVRIDTVREHDYGTSTGGDNWGVTKLTPKFVAMD